MLAISSLSCCGGKVPDIGVMIGDEMFIPCIFFLRGDMMEDKIEEALDSFFSSLLRFKLIGLFFSLFVRVDVEPMDGGAAGLGCWFAIWGGSNLTPASLAASCSITNLYISSN